MVWRGVTIIRGAWKVGNSFQSFPSFTWERDVLVAACANEKTFAHPTLELIFNRSQVKLGNDLQFWERSTKRRSRTLPYL